MYDIDIYSYKEIPVFNNRNNNILPLDENGLKKYYFGKDSHVRLFLNKKNPILIRKLLMKHNDSIKDKNLESKNRSFIFDNYPKINLKKAKINSNIIKESNLINKKIKKFRNNRALNEENRKYNENILFNNRLCMNKINKFNNSFKK